MWFTQLLSKDKGNIVRLTQVHSTQTKIPYNEPYSEYYTTTNLGLWVGTFKCPVMQEVCTCLVACGVLVGLPFQPLCLFLHPPRSNRVWALSCLQDELFGYMWSHLLHFARWLMIMAHHHLEQRWLRKISEVFVTVHNSCKYSKAEEATAYTMNTNMCIKYLSLSTSLMWYLQANIYQDW